MKFYNREKELELLEQTRNVAFNNHSQMTALTGRRRIGKTKLILKSCENTPTVYLFVRRSNEATLCSQFIEVARKSLNVYIPDGITSFVSLFESLMNIGKTESFNLVIDEFQEGDVAFKGTSVIWFHHCDAFYIKPLSKTLFSS